MPKRLSIIAVWLISCTMLFAQIQNLIPHSDAIAGTEAARQDTWSAFANPASLVQDRAWQVAVEYENRYLTAELSTCLAQAAYCNRYVNVGVGYSFFGFGAYNEMMATVVLARNFSRFSFGLAANLIAVYGGLSDGYLLTAVPQFGFTVAATADFTIGFQTFNPFIQTLRHADQHRPLPAIYSAGFDWRFLQNLRWSFAADYEAPIVYRIATGVEWQAIKQLCLKAGVEYRQYFIPCLGVSVVFGDLRISADSRLHPVLGLCTTARIAYSWH